MRSREAIIENYIAGYNEMDLQKMTRDLDEAVVFKNVSNEVVDMELYGLNAFKQQAEKALVLFSERKQTVTAIRHRDGAVEVDIGYDAILSQQPPEGLQKGQSLHFNGTTIFTFNKDNRITSLTDIS
jgi:hypothetical protein